MNQITATADANGTEKGASSDTALPQPAPRPMTVESYKRAIEICAANALGHHPHDASQRSQMFCAMLSGWISASDKGLSARIQAMYVEPVDAA